MRATDILRTLAPLLLLAAPVAAQQEALGELYLRADGDLVRAAIEIRISPGWHLYHEELGPPEAIGKPLRVTFAGEGFAWSAVHFPEPDKTNQPPPGTWIYTHHGTLVLHALGRSAPGASLGDVEVKLDGLTCQDDGLCVPYRETLSSEGAGADPLFAAFPADLVAPAAPAPPAPEVPAADVHLGGRADATLSARVEGARVLAEIEIVIEEGWHLYHKELGDPDAIAKPLTVELGGAGVTWGEIAWPEPHVYDQPGLDTTVLGHEGTIVLTVEGALAEGASVDGIFAQLVGQTCDPSFCINYKETIVLPRDDAGGNGGAVAAVGAVIDPSGLGTSLRTYEGAALSSTTFRDFLLGTGDYGQEDEEGLLLFLLAAVGWGLFTLLMPCTYPMIPITISFFTKQADARGGKVLPLSLAYGAGIVLIFVLIGVVFGAPIIRFATHPITNLVIGLLFVYFALVLFGLINMQPPRFMMNMSGKAASTGGYLGVFLMGATLVITSFTCTAPFVGSLLGVGAKFGLWEIALGMGVFGATMAIPFVFLSLVPGRIQAMPQSGMWMNTLKFTLGFVEIAAALKFFSNSDIVWLRKSTDPSSGFLSREVFLLAWVVIFLLAALYLLGILRFKDPEVAIGGKRRLAGVAFLALAAYSGWGFAGKAIDPVMVAIVPPYSGGIVPLDFATYEETWPVYENEYDEALARARREQKLLFVNFTGYT